MELPKAFTPRLLRSSFVTAMRTASADFEVLQAFIGHSPTSILSAHYDKIGLERMKPIADLAEDLYHARGSFEDATSESSKGDGLLH